jgi:hypothetical protein
MANDASFPVYLSAMLAVRRFVPSLSEPPNFTLQHPENCTGLTDSLLPPYTLPIISVG